MIWIDIDIHNSRPILDAIVRGILQLTGWTINNNTYDKTHPNAHWDTLPTKTARYFRLNLDTRHMTWQFSDDIHSEKLVDIRDLYTLQDAYDLVTFIKDNDELFGDPITLFFTEPKSPQESLLDSTFIKDATQDLANEIDKGFLDSMAKSLGDFQSKLFSKTEVPNIYFDTEAKPPMYKHYKKEHKSPWIMDENPYQMKGVDIGEITKAYGKSLVKKYNNSEPKTLFIDTISDSIDSDKTLDEITQKQTQDSWDAVNAASYAFSLTKK